MFRLGVAVFTLLCIVVWLFQGHEWVNTSTEKSSSQTWAAEQIAQFQRTDPALADLIEQAQRDLPQLQALQVIEQSLGETGLREVIHDKQNGQTNALQWVAQMGLNRQQFVTEDERQQFVQSYGLFFAGLRENGMQHTSQLTELLNTYSRSDSAWQFFQHDPIGLLVWDSVSEPELREFYLNQGDWLAEVLSQLTPSIDSSDPYDLAPLRSLFHDVLAAAYQFQPLPQQAYALEDSGIIGFTLFLPTPEGEAGLGALIQTLVQQGVPLAEALAIATANADFLLQQQQSSSTAVTAQALVRLYQARRMVWQQAQIYPLVLQADHDFPSLSEALLKRYGEQGVLDFLYTWYDDPERVNLIKHAAQALVRYEDLAVFQLNRGKEDPRFLDVLAQDFRIVPYAAVRGDAALDQVLAEPNWLNKHFHQDGSPREAEWWSALPIVGGSAHLVKELIGGYPITWSEFGWAALDVVDGALLIASFGASTAATSAGKSTVKTGTKAATRRIMQNRARQAFTKAGSTQLAARSGGRNFMQRSLGRLTGNAFARNTIHVLRWSKAAIIQGGKSTITVIRNSLTRWQAVSPTVRKWVYRSLLAIGLWKTWEYRTWPMLQTQGAELPAHIVEGTVKLIQNTVDSLSEAIEAQLLSNIGLNENWRTQVSFWLVLLILILPLWWALLPLLRWATPRRAQRA